MPPILVQDHSRIACLVHANLNVMCAQQLNQAPHLSERLRGLGLEPGQSSTIARLAETRRMVEMHVEPVKHLPKPSLFCDRQVAAVTEFMSRNENPLFPVRVWVRGKEGKTKVHRLDGPLTNRAVQANQVVPRAEPDDTERSAGRKVTGVTTVKQGRFGGFSPIPAKRMSTSEYNTMVLPFAWAGGLSSGQGGLGTNERALCPQRRRGTARNGIARRMANSGSERDVLPSAPLDSGHGIESCQRG